MFGGLPPSPPFPPLPYSIVKQCGEVERAKTPHSFSLLTPACFSDVWVAGGLTASLPLRLKTVFRGLPPSPSPSLPSPAYPPSIRKQCVEGNRTNAPHSSLCFTQAGPSHVCLAGRLAGCNLSGCPFGWLLVPSYLFNTLVLQTLSPSPAPPPSIPIHLLSFSFLQINSNMGR